MDPIVVGSGTVLHGGAREHTSPGEAVPDIMKLDKTTCGQRPTLRSWLRLGWANRSDSGGSSATCLAHSCSIRNITSCHNGDHSSGGKYIFLIGNLWAGLRECISLLALSINARLPAAVQQL